MHEASRLEYGGRRYMVYARGDSNAAQVSVYEDDRLIIRYKEERIGELTYIKTLDVALTTATDLYYELWDAAVAKKYDKPSSHNILDTGHLYA